MKTCNKGKENKHKDEFGKDKSTKDGLRWVCKACNAANSRAYYKANSKKVKAYQEVRRHSNPTKQPSKMLKARYGITLDEYDIILLSQNGCCTICGSDTPGGRGRFHVDHCHASGKLRGLLCHNCNTALGNFKDSLDVMAKAIAYLNT